MKSEISIKKMQKIIDDVEANNPSSIDVIFTADGRELRTLSELEDYLEGHFCKQRNNKWVNYPRLVCLMCYEKEKK